VSVGVVAVLDVVEVVVVVVGVVLVLVLVVVLAVVVELVEVEVLGLVVGDVVGVEAVVVAFWRHSRSASRAIVPAPWLKLLRRRGLTVTGRV
jgi:hypothetical protein